MQPCDKFSGKMKIIWISQATQTVIKLRVGIYLKIQIKHFMDFSMVAEMNYSVSIINQVFMLSE